MVPKGALVPIRFVAIGVSMGGTHALRILLPGVPANFPATLALVFHRSKDSDGSLIKFLQKNCAIKVAEAQDKTPILPGHVYVAPADYHLMVEDNHFALSTEEPISYARPSVDVLFESVADAYGKSAAGVILTGAGRDGAQGIMEIKQAGGLTIVQAPETAECPDMPNAALATHKVDEVLALERIAPFLVSRCT